MAQRREPADSLDFFPTPPWATRAFCEWLAERPGFRRTAWEPACGRGDMAQPLAEYFGQVIASDVHDYGFGTVRDFLWPGDDEPVDWIITNPPFRLAAEFIARAHQVAQCGIAMLVRTAFLEGGERHASLFAQTPPSDILQFAERVPMFRGRLDAEGSTATAYCWLVWRYLKRPAPVTVFHWIAPCRARLERPGDYPAPAVEAAAAPLFD
jgi:hypothetical protein